MSSDPTAGGSGGIDEIDSIEVSDRTGNAVSQSEPLERLEKGRAAAATRQRKADAVDLALFERVALERSEEAFSELYDRYAPRLYAMMLHYVRVEEDALDLLQDMFILLWEKAPLLYRENTHARAAIYHFARNCAIDAVRSRKWRDKSFEPLPEDQPTLDDLLREESTPETNLNAKEAREQVRDALRMLSDIQRAAIDLAYFGGLTQSEIAKRLNVTEGVVRSAIYGAIRKLGRLLPPRFEEPAKPLERVENLPKEATRKNPISIKPFGND